MPIRGMFVVFSLFCLLLIQGCVAVQTFPTVARAGDTIMLAVGSPDNMKKSNINVAFVSNSDSVPIDVTASVRAITKVYPDKMSKAWLGGIPGLIPGGSAHGGWLSVVVIDLPADLPVGTGYFDITTQPEVTYPVNSKTIDTVQVGIEILPGLGVSNTFQYAPYAWSTPLAGVLSDLEANNHLLIKSSFPASGEAIEYYGAIEVKVNAPIRQNSDGAPVSDKVIKVVFDDQPGNLDSQKQASWSRVNDLFTFNFISPTASLTFKEIRAAIVLRRDKLNSFTDVQNINIESIRFFNALGIEVSGKTPTIILNQN